MLKQGVILLYLFFLLVSCRGTVHAQKNCNGLKKVKCYVQSIARGIAPSAEIEIEAPRLIIVAEAPINESVEVKSIWYNNESYSAITTKLRADTSLGKTTGDQSVYIKKHTTNQNWVITSEKDQNKKKLPAKFKQLKTGSILIRFKVGNQLGYCIIPKAESLLLPHPSETLIP